LGCKTHIPPVRRVALRAFFIYKAPVATLGCFFAVLGYEKTIDLLQKQEE
jgi:hypothetical protein